MYIFFYMLLDTYTCIQVNKSHSYRYTNVYTQECICKYVYIYINTYSKDSTRSLQTLIKNNMHKHIYCN